MLIHSIHRNIHPLHGPSSAEIPKTSSKDSREMRLFQKTCWVVGLCIDDDDDDDDDAHNVSKCIKMYQNVS